jgi:hypothetical protein
MTGLSLRVIRVWYQNKRCKDNKKKIAMGKQGRVSPLMDVINDVGIPQCVIAKKDRSQRRRRPL